MGRRLPGRGLAIAVTVGLGLVSACGDPNQLGAADPTTIDVTTTDEASTVTSIVVPPGAATSLPSLPSVPLTTPDQRAVATLEDGASWCPEMSRDAVPGTDEEMRRAGEIGERAVGLANVYAAAHADVAGTPWLDWPRSGPRAVIGFTRDVAVHAAALHAQLERPEELFVCQVRHSAAEIAAAADEIQQQMMGSNGASSPYVSAGAGPLGVDVTLRPDQQTLADELLVRYGDLVVVTLGLWPYPKGSRPVSDIALRACAGAAVGGPTVLDGLRARATPQPATVASGEEFGGTVVITNEGTVPASFQSGDPLVGYLVRPGTDAVVGISTMGIAGVGAGGTLAPGESHELHLQAGTTSCTPDHYAVEPGTYELVVPVVVGYGEQATTPPTNRLVTERATVTVRG